MDNQSISNRLQSGERILWSGQPGGGLLFTAGDIFLIPFSLVWLSGVSTIFFQAGNGKGEFILMPILFLGIGLFITFGRFLLDIWLRHRTTYAVTSERVVIERGAPFAQSLFLPLATLPQVELQGNPVSRGTLRFAMAASAWPGRGFGSAVPALSTIPQFLAIDDAGAVYELIMKATRDLRTATAR